MGSSVASSTRSSQRHGRSLPKRAWLRSRISRSVKSIHRAESRTRGTAFRTTSNPMPAGSPDEIAMVGFMKEKGKERELVVFLVFVLFVHVLDVVLQNQQVGFWPAIDLNRIFVVPLDGSLD